MKEKWLTRKRGSNNQIGRHFLKGRKKKLPRMEDPWISVRKSPEIRSMVRAIERIQRSPEHKKLLRERKKYFKEFHARVDKIVGYKCHRCKFSTKDPVKIVQHLVSRHRIKPDEQDIDGWTSRDEKAWKESLKKRKFRRK